MTKRFLLTLKGYSSGQSHFLEINVKLFASSCILAQTVGAS